MSQFIIQKKLTLAEIYQQYPDQWVLIVEPELDEDLEVIQGEVIASSPDRDGLYDQLHLRKGVTSSLPVISLSWFNCAGKIINNFEVLGYDIPQSKQG